MEKIIDKKLRWLLENQGFFNNHQNTFREHRSTLDSRVGLETGIRDAFINDDHLMSVSLYIKKCYKIIWRNRILHILLDNGIDGSMIIFIKNFHRERFIQERLNGHLYKKVKLENGIPQGSDLSVTLLQIIFNDTNNFIPRPKKNLFSDDLTIYCSGKSLSTTQEILQDSLNNVLEWSVQTGLQLHKTKSKCILFYKKTPLEHIPALYLNNHELEVVGTLKILGLIFDTRLTWTPHLKYLKSDCYNRLNLVKSLAKINYGADKHY